MTLEAATYTGNARKVEFTFSAYPEQLDFVNNWLIENFLDNLKKEASAQYGAKVLELRLWRDTSPTWQTNYKGELVTSIPEGFSAIPFAVLAVIVVALAAITGAADVKNHAASWTSTHSLADLGFWRRTRAFPKAGLDNARQSWQAMNRSIGWFL